MAGESPEMLCDDLMPHRAEALQINPIAMCSEHFRARPTARQPLQGDLHLRNKAERSGTRADGEEVADDIPRVSSFHLYRSLNERFKDNCGMILGDADQGLRCARRGTMPLLPLLQSPL